MVEISQPRKNKKYMVQLDSLRAIAVFGVLIHHYNPSSFVASFNYGSIFYRL